jgi:type II pantothenate kinase
LIQKAYPSPRRSGAEVGPQLGADVGATLAKLAIRPRDGELGLRLMPSAAIDQLATEIESLGAKRIVLTGGGAAQLAERLGLGLAPVNEFEAWATGARAILQREGRAIPERFLLVSVGTGTSAMLVEESSSVRVGGTALGGGTLAGLAAALVGTSDFDAVTQLAREGDRRRVDLLVGDIYPSGVLPLPGDLNAASFAKLALGEEERAPDRRDLAHAIMGLVGENVALICGGLAVASGVSRIVYGGTTLRNNPSITNLLRALAPAHACEATILGDGEFTGALGALALAATAGS